MEREKMASRLGFLLVSAGCAIGLGNVWRFPYITGKYGGAVFVAVYLFFLLMMALPLLIMELSVGRASKQNLGNALRVLEPEGTKWHRMGWISLVGSYLLMMFYIPVSGWMIQYVWKTASGQLSLPAQQLPAAFGSMLADPVSMTVWTFIVSALSFGVCAFGLQKGIERVVKFMMSGLFIILMVLAVKAMTLSGGMEGIKFYLAPDWQRAMDAGIWSLINDAMNQAFFTLGLGIGSICIFGSYLGDEHTITQESLIIVCLDTFVALVSGLIIFPSCFAFGVEPGAGPGLVFITLPNVFNEMSGGRFWGTLFFIFMSAAALTTVITVVENIISYSVDVWKWTRSRSVKVNFVVLTLLTLPCILGFNVLSWIEPLGKGTNLMDLEDFILSNNLLSIGAITFMLFCCSRYGWGWKGFLGEVDKGEGLKFPKYFKFYLTWILPLVVLFVFIQGYVQRFFL